MISPGACAYKQGAIVLDDTLPVPKEDAACAGCPSSGPDDCARKCSTYDQCKSWTVRKDTNACWLFKTPGKRLNKGAEEWVYGVPCKSLGTFYSHHHFSSLK